VTSQPGEKRQAGSCGNASGNSSEEGTLKVTRRANQFAAGARRDNPSGIDDDKSIAAVLNLMQAMG